MVLASGQSPPMWWAVRRVQRPSSPFRVRVGRARRLRGRIQRRKGIGGGSPGRTAAWSNPGPVVTLTAPSEGASGVAPATFALAATASDSDGVQKVEFYESGSTTPLATSTNGTGNGATPYTATWSNVAAGAYTVTA